jgi:hypothetical protein
MIKDRTLILVICFVISFTSALLSSALAQNAPSAGAVGIGALPGGPGGRDVPIEPPPRPDPLLPFYNPCRSERRILYPAWNSRRK